MDGFSRLSIFIGNIVTYIIQPIMTLLFALALAYFVWGLAQFILNADSSDERTKGKEKIIWGIIGLFIMTAVIGILSVVTNTFGVSLPR